MHYREEPNLITPVLNNQSNQQHRLQTSADPFRFGVADSFVAEHQPTTFRSSKVTDDIPLKDGVNKTYYHEQSVDHGDIQLNSVSPLSLNLSFQEDSEIDSCFNDAFM